MFLDQTDLAVLYTDGNLMESMDHLHMSCTGVRSMSTWIPVKAQSVWKRLSQGSLVEPFPQDVFEHLNWVFATVAPQSHSPARDKAI